MYQKHGEKQSRLNALYNSKDKQIDMGDIDPEEVKFSLIRDPRKRARAMIRQETAALEAEARLAKATAEKIGSFGEERAELVESRERAKRDIQAFGEFTKTQNTLSDKQFTEKYKIEDPTDIQLWPHSDLGIPAMGYISASSVKEARQEIADLVETKTDDAKHTIQSSDRKIKSIDNVLARYQIDPVTNENIAAGKARIERSGEEAAQKAAVIDKSFKAYAEKAAREIAQESHAGESFGYAVQRVGGEINGNIRPMERKEPQVEETRQTVQAPPVQEKPAPQRKQSRQAEWDWD
jgi:hypothetical protein